MIWMHVKKMNYFSYFPASCKIL